MLRRLLPALLLIALPWATDARAQTCTGPEPTCQVNDLGYEVCRIPDYTHHGVWAPPFLPDGSVVVGNPHQGHRVTRPDGCTYSLPAWSDRGEHVYASLEGDYMIGTRDGAVYRIERGTLEERRLASLGSNYHLSPPGDEDCMLAVSRDGDVKAIHPQATDPVIDLHTDVLQGAMAHRLLCDRPGLGFLNIEKAGGRAARRGGDVGLGRGRGGRGRGRGQGAPVGGTRSAGRTPGDRGGEGYILAWDERGSVDLRRCPDMIVHPYLHDDKIYGFEAGSRTLIVTDCQGYRETLIPSIHQSHGAHISVGQHDGRTVAVLSLEGRIELMDLETGERTVIARHDASHDLRAGGIAYARISPDGRFVGFNSDEEGRAFYVIRLDRSGTEAPGWTSSGDSEAEPAGEAGEEGAESPDSGEKGGDEDAPGPRAER